MAPLLVTSTLGEQGWEGLALRTQTRLSLPNNLYKVLRFESCIRFPGRLVKSRLLTHLEVPIQWAWHMADAVLVTKNLVKMLLLVPASSLEELGFGGPS